MFSFGNPGIGFSSAFYRLGAIILPFAGTLVSILSYCFLKYHIFKQLSNLTFSGRRNSFGLRNYTFCNVSHRYVDNLLRAVNTWCETFSDFGRGKSMVYREKMVFVNNKRWKVRSSKTKISRKICR